MTNLLRTDTRVHEHAVSNDRVSRTAIAPRLSGVCLSVYARGAYTPGVKLHHYGLVTLQSFCHPRLSPSRIVSAVGYRYRETQLSPVELPLCAK